MSVRATWSTTEFVDIEITDDFTDQHSSTIEEGGLAILLGQDEDCFVIEGMDVTDLRAFIHRLTDRVNTYARQHGEDFPEPAKTKVWTCAVKTPDSPGVIATVHQTEDECFESLRENYDPEGDADDEPPVAIVGHLEDEGYTINIDVHEI